MDFRSIINVRRYYSFDPMRKKNIDKNEHKNIPTHATNKPKKNRIQELHPQALKQNHRYMQSSITSIKKFFNEK